jgi:exodeoxyribonuclease VII large subunit
MKREDFTMDLFAPAPAPSPPAPLSVSDFTRCLKSIVENGFSAVSVRGEISNLRRQTSGHVYFTLKDAASQLSAVLFRNDALRARCELRDGLQVVASGSVNIYEPRGTYQLVVRAIEADGVGRLQQEFERLKQKLAAEGLFDRELKRPLPLLPRVLGIITSPTGAALQDFLRILRRRDWRGRVVVLPARVQGAEAASEIADALRLANSLALFDLLVLSRGGGSLEDLWPFNEERVVRAIRASAVPVVSAVGHETDFTLGDFAADARAETPSAAAELISSGFLACLERLERAQKTLRQAPRLRLETLARRLALTGSELARHAPARRVESAWLRLDDLRNRLQSTPLLAAGRFRRRLDEARSRLGAGSPAMRVRMGGNLLAVLTDRLRAALARRLERAGDKLLSLERRLQASGVDATLRRGFALVLDAADGRVLRSAEKITPGRALRVRFADGEAEATGAGARQR